MNTEAGLAESNVFSKKQQEANLDDLIHRYLFGIFGKRTLKDRNVEQEILVFKENGFTVEGLQPTNSHAVKILTGLGIFEIALSVGFISADHNAEFWDLVKQFLLKMEFEKSNIHHPLFALPKLLLKRLNGNKNCPVFADPDSAFYFLDFLSIDNRFNKYLRPFTNRYSNKHGLFIRLLNGYEPDEFQFDDFLNVIADPEECVWRLFEPPNDCDLLTSTVQQLNHWVTFHHESNKFLEGCSVIGGGEMFSMICCYIHSMIRNSNVFIERRKMVLDCFLKWEKKVPVNSEKAHIRGFVYLYANTFSKLWDSNNLKYVAKNTQLEWHLEARYKYPSYVDVFVHKHETTSDKIAEAIAGKIKFHPGQIKTLLGTDADKFSKLTVIEAAELVKQLETKWGVSAAAPIAVAAAHPAPGGKSSAKDTFDVILASVPADKKIAVIKAVREVKAGLGLAEAKALVEGAPKPLLEGGSKADAEVVAKAVEQAGGKIELK